ncbi:DUF126 domain-containing protein [Arthrobacter sp. NPDC089319]|uniref:aconitase X swivel domain-containing protein n=1 Tax=Arthrobacter sp. NPDC089319 TaxID=3155915 RepID=UPI003412667B
MTVVLVGRGLVPGVVEAEALVTNEPISGWGGIDPESGKIIDTHHELRGAVFTGKVLVFPSAKGSSGWSGFFQATRLNGTAPAGLVFNVVSTKSALGAVVTRVPTVASFGYSPAERIRTGDLVRVDGGTGTVTVLETAAESSNSDLYR